MIRWNDTVKAYIRIIAYITITVIFVNVGFYEFVSPVIKVNWILQGAIFMQIFWCIVGNTRNLMVIKVSIHLFGRH